VSTISNSLNVGKITATGNDPIGIANFTDASTGNKYLKGDTYNDAAEEIATLNEALALAATKSVRASNYVSMLNKASAEDALRVLKKRKGRERENYCGV
jgi:hypothetical protein